MDHGQFWAIIDGARLAAADPSDAEAVASQVTDVLADLPESEIVASEQVIWDLMADSYTSGLWAAAYQINGGCSDDMFDYFRSWLILQGRAIFERVIAAPDELADLSVVQAAAADGEDIACDAALIIPRAAYEKATGRELPGGAFTIRYPELEPGWDFDDSAEMRRRLPKLTALCPE